MSKRVVLFVCQHNAGRSQLGAAMLELLAPGRFEVRSGGTSPAPTPKREVVESVRELGLDIADRRPRRVTADDARESDVIVLMKPGLELPVPARGTILEWAFPDPSSWDADGVRALRESIASRIRAELLDDA